MSASSLIRFPEKKKAFSLFKYKQGRQITKFLNMTNNIHYSKNEYNTNFLFIIEFDGYLEQFVKISVYLCRIIIEMKNLKDTRSCYIML